MPGITRQLEGLRHGGSLGTRAFIVHARCLLPTVSDSNPEHAYTTERPSGHLSGVSRTGPPVVSEQRTLAKHIGIAGWPSCGLGCMTLQEFTVKELIKKYVAFRYCLRQYTSCEAGYLLPVGLHGSRE